MQILGSGGIFGPGMVIGGILGALIWRVSHHLLPGLPNTPAPFVIVGMMALFGGIAHAPLAVMLMVAEMTGNLSMLAPAMILRSSQLPLHKISFHCGPRRNLRAPSRPTVDHDAFRSMLTESLTF